MNLVMITVYIPSPPPPTITRPPLAWGSPHIQYAPPSRRSSSSGEGEARTGRRAGRRAGGPSRSSKKPQVSARSYIVRRFERSSHWHSLRNLPRDARLRLFGEPLLLGTRTKGSEDSSVKPWLHCASSLCTFFWLSLLMDTDEPSTPDMPSRRPHKHLCKVCNKKFLSGKALGGHMSCHRHSGKQPKSKPSPAAIVVDLPVLLLGHSDEKPSPSSLESQCLRCSKVFSSCQSPRGDMGMHSEMAKPNEEPEPAGLMEALANANGDHGHNVMLFSPVKRKRSKRGMSVLNSEMNAAAALLMLAEHSDKTSAYEDCCGGDQDDISTPMALKEVNLNAFEQLDQSDEFTNSVRLKSDKNPAYEGFYENCEKENSLNLVADAPKKEVLLDLFDYEMDVEAEFMKPGADISVKELKSSLNLVADAPKKEVLLNVFDHGMDVDAEFMKPGADISVEELESSLNLVADAPKKGVLMNVFDHGMDVDAEFMKPGADISVEELESSLNLVADAPMKGVLMNVFDHGMDVDAEFMKPGADISVEELKSSDLSSAMNIKRHQCKVCGKSLRSGQALGGHMTLQLHFEKKNKLNSVADVPKEVLLNAFDHEVDADIEFMTPGAAISVELESSDISATVSVKKHQCKVCGKVLGSGRALGGHMRLHYVRKCNLHQEVANCPDSVMMEEQNAEA